MQSWRAVIAGLAVCVLHGLVLLALLSRAGTPASSSGATIHDSVLLWLTLAPRDVPAAASHKVQKPPTTKPVVASLPEPQPQDAPTAAAPADVPAALPPIAPEEVPAATGSRAQTIEQSSHPVNAVLDAYSGMLWQRIVRRRPAALGFTGTVRVRFRVDRAGRIETLELMESSGVTRLDRAALKAVRDASPFPPPPKDLTDDQLEFSVPVQFM